MKKNLSKDLMNYLTENGLRVDDIEQIDNLSTIEITIEWGDWKHEHRRCAYLVDKFSKIENMDICYLGCTTLEEDGSDCYSGLHRFLVVY